MTMDPTDYEEAVSLIAKRIAETKEIKIIHGPSYGRRNRVLGKSGINHQIDVSVEYRSKDGINRIKLIECKMRSSKKMGISDVLAFHSRIVDIQARFGEERIVEGNLFTTHGYTAPAKAYADHYSIATNSLATDLGAWSMSYADQVVVALRTARISADSSLNGVIAG